jgi:hypothetical protein
VTLDDDENGFAKGLERRIESVRRAVNTFLNRPSSSQMRWTESRIGREARNV